MTPGSDIDKASVVYNTAAAEQSLSGEIRNSFEIHRNDTQTVVFIPDDLPSTTNIDKQVASLTKHPTVKKVTYRSSSSSARTWEVGIDEWMNRAKVPDPIVVIMPNSNLNLSDRNLVAGVTQLDVLLRSYEDFHQLQNNESVGSFVRSAVPMSQTWSQHHQAMGRILWVYIGGLVVSVLLCILSSFAVWASFIKVFHQRIRVAYLHARWLFSPTMTALIAEAAVGFWILHFLNQRAQTAQAWERGGSAEGTAEPAMIALFQVPNAAWWVAITLFFATSIFTSTFLLRRQALQQLVLTRR